MSHQGGAHHTHSCEHLCVSDTNLRMLPRLFSFKHLISIRKMILYSSFIGEKGRVQRVKQFVQEHDQWELQRWIWASCDWLPYCPIKLQHHEATVRPFPTTHCTSSANPTLSCISLWLSKLPACHLTSRHLRPSLQTWEAAAARHLNFQCLGFHTTVLEDYTCLIGEHGNN